MDGEGAIPRKAGGGGGRGSQGDWSLGALHCGLWVNAFGIGSVTWISLHQTKISLLVLLFTPTLAPYNIDTVNGTCMLQIAPWNGRRTSGTCAPNASTSHFTRLQISHSYFTLTLTLVHQPKG